MGYLPLSLRDSDSQATRILDMNISFRSVSVTGDKNERTKPVFPGICMQHASCDFGIFTNVIDWVVLKTLLRWDYLKGGVKSLWKNLAFIYGHVQTCEHSQPENITAAINYFDPP
jgi:hypothetical protein